MTPVPPEHDEGAYGEPYGEPRESAPYGDDPYRSEPYGSNGSYRQEYDDEAFQAAVDALDDPLNDPLPGQRRAAQQARRQAQQQAPRRTPPAQPAPPTQPTQPTQRQQRPGWEHLSYEGPHGTSAAQRPDRNPDRNQGHDQDEEAARDRLASLLAATRAAEAAKAARAPEAEPIPPAPTPRAAPTPPPAPAPRRPAGPAPGPGPQQAPRQGHGTFAGGAETAAMPAVGAPAGPAAPTTPATRPAPAAPAEEEDRRTMGLRRPDEAELGGRAARRHAAQGRGKSRARTAQPTAPVARPGSRLEARRAARAAKDGPAIIASRFMGEVFITVGVVMLLFVAYQLWWTNVLAGREAGGAASKLQDQWKHGGGGAHGGKAGKHGGKEMDPARRAGKFAPGEGFAIIHIPKLDIDVPIAQGVSKAQVLDKGLVGHYDKAPLKTAMPWDEKGNFALAGHRNTHGEPFRYINRLAVGDEVVVETATTYYTYRMTNRLPATSPSNTSVISPIPVGSGFTGPGRYVTLTTCTPEFTSKYRLIVWGKMVDERPRSKGKPDALVE